MVELLLEKLKVNCDSTEIMWAVKNYIVNRQPLAYLYTSMYGTDVTISDRRLIYNMDAKKYYIYELNEFDEIIVYGAGVAGKTYLGFFERSMFPKSKLKVWDINYDKIGTICGYSVCKPDFDSVSNKDVPILIALMPQANENLLEEIRGEFLSRGFNNFIVLGEYSFDSQQKTLFLKDFEKIVNSGIMYECNYQNDIDFSRFKPKVKALAYYLPQFHDIPENDKWWGKGYTEWTNTRKAEPYFKGHYQPREPHDDLGYYDLTDVETIRKQATIAKRHGIYGWCIYYYWFSGKRLLEKPIDILLENKDIDINFCFEWANESWTKQWVGNDKEVIAEQKYLQDDPEKFIDDLKKYFDDPRYIRINHKPLIIIYQPQNIPDFLSVVRRWRKHSIDVGIGDLHILINCREYTPAKLNAKNVIDGAAAFSWHIPLLDSICSIVKSQNGETEYGRVQDYASYVDAYKYFLRYDSEYSPFYRACFACWDNTPRYTRQSAGFFTCNINFSLRKFYEMVEAIVNESVTDNKEFMFVFSWNEWCEGSYIEPDKKYGYAIINTLSRAICGLPYDVGGELCPS